MKQAPHKYNIVGDMKLLDTILDLKLDSKTFASNQSIILKVGKLVDDLAKIPEGYALASVTKENKRSLILIVKTEGYKSARNYSIYNWKLKESIEKRFDLECHEISSDLTIINKCSNASGHHSDANINLSVAVSETLNGYSINEKPLDNFLAFKENTGIKDGSRSEVYNWGKDIDSLLIGKRVCSKVKLTKDKFKGAITTLVEKSADVPITLNLSNEYPATGVYIAGKIDEVRLIGGQRYYKVRHINYARARIGNLSYGTQLGKMSSGVEGNAMSAEQIGSSYMFTTKSSRWETPEGKFDENNLIRIPYNLIDKDRLILACRTKKFEWNIFVSPDPKVDVNYKETFEKDINDYLKRTCNKLDGTDTTYIYDEAVQGSLYYSTFITNAKHSNANIKGIPLYLKAMKDMLDEYNYVIKKNKATGSDVTITDNIKYNHEKGRISYNDFSIEIDDEMLKADLYETFNAHLIKYYRNESTEQEILDNITYTVFISLQRRINNNRSNFSITIKINDVVEINLKARKSEKNGAIFYYLNNKRFNKNEIITLLREMTCYRNATEATAFISNISRLGLAVYIGITTGYEVKISKDKNQVFKFRKLKGRANYQLILDGTDVPIKGKKLITLLTDIFFPFPILKIWPNICLFSEKPAKTFASTTSFTKVKSRVCSPSP